MSVRTIVLLVSTAITIGIVATAHWSLGWIARQFSADFAYGAIFGGLLFGGLIYLAAREDRRNYMRSASDAADRGQQQRPRHTIDLS